MMNNEIKAHYASPGLYERIVQGADAIGKSPASVDLDDLAAVDEFHLRGPAATRELIEILDVGADFHGGGGQRYSHSQELKTQQS